MYRRLTRSIQSALHDFISSSVHESDLSGSILPTMEKALLRSPEVSLSGEFVPRHRMIVIEHRPQSFPTSSQHTATHSKVQRTDVCSPQL